MRASRRRRRPSDHEPSPQRRGRRPTAPALLVIGLALAVVGAGAWWATTSFGRSSARVLGGNRPVNAGAKEPLDISANNSPSLRANPKNPANLALANRVDSPTSSCSLRVSLDGGASWTVTPVVEPEDRSIGCFSPDVAFGADGTLFLAFTSFASLNELTPTPDALWLARSNDGGRTMSRPAQVAGPSVFDVRLSPDPSAASRVYLTWLQGGATSTWGFAQDGNPIVVARSDDGGLTWSAPVQANPTSRRRVVAPSPVLDATGRLFIAYLDVGDDDLDYLGGHEGRGGAPFQGRWTLVVARSVDKGTSWAESVVDPGIVPVQRFLVLHPPAPSLAVAPGAQRLYVGFHDGRLGDPDVWVWASRDGGLRWSGSGLGDGAHHRDRSSQYLPQLAVAPNGRLDAVYYDRSKDPNDVMSGVSISSSFDQGETFQPPAEVSDSQFDSRIGRGSDRGLPDLGDRLGLVSTNAGALGVWTDTRAAQPENGKQDLASALVEITSPLAFRRPVRTLSQIVALVGALLAVAAMGRVVGRRRARNRPDSFL